MRKFHSLWILSLFYVSFAGASQALKSIPIQDAGRVKPYDTFARETLQMVHGKETFDSRPATEIVLTWLIQPDGWQAKPLIEIKHHLVKKALRFDNEKKYFTLQEVWSNDRLTLLMQELLAKRETKEKLDPYFSALQHLETQLYLFREIAAGRLLRFVPPAEGDAWRGIPDFLPDEQEAFREVVKNFVENLGTNGGNEALLQKSIDQFKAVARSKNSAQYPEEKTISTEVFYNQFHPFRWAWVFYGLCAMLLGMHWILGKSIFYKLGWTAAGIGLALHVFGMGIRMYLMGRPPVTNMYETVVWVAFGCILFAMIMEAVYRWRFILLSGAIFSAFCLVLANLAPAVLDKSLQPLEPVLRSNYWLTIHVMTITISYSGFFLAFAMGDIGLFFFAKDEKKYEAQIKAVVLAIYRSIQVGVAFLAPGIILGGIWADYSWGRFWGWDPKETWALIVLLGYVAVLHGRLSGWLRDFGMVTAAILTSSLVIMAWYGVNFVLGAGLHSYGFGAGGVEYVSTFVAVHILLVIFVAVLRQGKLKAN